MAESKTYLFLGGPWHRQRHAIPDGRFSVSVAISDPFVYQIGKPLRMQPMKKADYHWDSMAFGVRKETVTLFILDGMDENAAMLMLADYVNRGEIAQAETNP